MSVLVNTIITTTQLKEVAKGVYSGWQEENGVNITLFVYDNGSKRVMVSKGTDMICEFDLPT